MTKIFKCKIELIKLISVNKKFLTHPTYIINKEYLAGLFSIANKKKVTFEKPVRVDIMIHTLKDADNSTKPILDAMTFIKILKDDVLVEELNTSIFRGELIKKELESLYIEAVELTPAQMKSKEIRFKKTFKNLK